MLDNNNVYNGRNMIIVKNSEDTDSGRRKINCFRC